MSSGDSKSGVCFRLSNPLEVLRLNRSISSPPLSFHETDSLAVNVYISLVFSAIDLLLTASPIFPDGPLIFGDVISLTERLKDFERVFPPLSVVCNRILYEDFVS